MISSEICVKVTFDEAGRNKIECAACTINEVIEALQKSGAGDEGMIHVLDEAGAHLMAILDGITF